MRLVPFSYNVRSLFVRWSATLLTVVSIGATVAVLAGVLALRKGFDTLFTSGGRDDIGVFLRVGSNSEGDSMFETERAEILMKSLPEIDLDESGAPLAGTELYLAIRLRKQDGGETNVPIRGVQPATFRIRGKGIRIVDGDGLSPGEDEVIVGRPLSERIRGARVGDVIQLNTTPFRVVGVFEADGPYASEIWGDLERMSEALERPFPNRVVAKLRDGTNVKGLAERMENDKQVPVKVLTERDYLASQTTALSETLAGLGVLLGLIMGVAAVFTGTNTMLAALSSRVHEIGILLSLGFRPFAIFLAFLFESLLLGALGGIAGCLIVLPLNGVETGTTNFQTFTEVAFAFRVTPGVLLSAVIFAAMLGVIGGAWPALRAARMGAIEALRRH